MNTEAYIPYVAGAAVIAALALFGWVIRLQRRIDHLLKGKDAKSLEETIASVVRDIAVLKQYRKDSSDYLQTIEDRIQKSVQCVETLRFNPFKGQGEGGNQSFATAFVNEKGEGVILTSLHIRDRVSVYAKPLKAFDSEHELTEEERHVIDRAKGSVTGEK